MSTETTGSKAAPQRATPQFAYDRIAGMLAAIGSPSWREPYQAFHKKMEAQFLALPASTGGHHCWPGGYAVHIHEVMHNARTLRMILPVKDEVNMDELLVAAYIHDLDKLLYRYEEDREYPTDPQIKKAKGLGIQIEDWDTKSTVSCRIDAALHNEQLDAARLPRHTRAAGALDLEDSGIVMYLCAKHELPVSVPILHSIGVHHGGWAPLARANYKVELSAMAAVLHAADLLSSHSQKGEVKWLP